MMELSEISVGDGLVLENGAEREPVVVGKMGKRCVYATNHARQPMCRNRIVHQLGDCCEVRCRSRGIARISACGRG